MRVASAARSRSRTSGAKCWATSPAIRRPSPAHCAALGEALARLHLAGLDFTYSRVNALSVNGWRSLYENCSARANEVQPELKQFLAAELAHLENAWPSNLPRGVIHADLFPDNVFFLGNKLSGLIDFYFACTDTLVYDVAICLNAWCFEPDHSYNVTKGKSLLQAYALVRPKDPFEYYRKLRFHQSVKSVRDYGIEA